MIPPPPKTTRTVTLFPYPTLCRSHTWGKAKPGIAGLGDGIAFKHFQGDLAATTLAGDILDLLQHLLAQPQPAKRRHHHHIVDIDKRSAGEGRKTRSEEHTSELQSQMRIPYAAFCLKTLTQQT